MSALPPKADITAVQTNVRFVPKADERQCSKKGLEERGAMLGQAAAPQPEPQRTGQHPHGIAAGLFVSRHVEDRRQNALTLGR